MKSKLSFKRLILLMIIISLCTYALHYAIFRDAHHIFIFFVHDIAFLPLEVILVSLVFERLIERAEKGSAMQKSHMIESVFFSESGSDMLRYLVSLDRRRDELQSRICPDESWREADFASVRQFTASRGFDVRAEDIDFYALHYHLSTRHSYFLKVIENPALMEKDRFTDLILEIYHLWEELNVYDNLYELSPVDRAALAVTVNSIYRLLTEEWLDNAEYLICNQKYRVGSMMRSNPFI